MSINPEIVGRVYPSENTYVVGREKIREFARAVHAENPLHHDVEAARAAGYADVIAPPTFAIILAQAADAALINADHPGDRVRAGRGARRPALQPPPPHRCW